MAGALLDTHTLYWLLTAVDTLSEDSLVSIRQAIAVEAANVPIVTGHRDPGDCFLVATARVKKVPIFTRDSIIRDISTSGYVEVIVC